MVLLACVGCKFEETAPSTVNQGTTISWRWTKETKDLVTPLFDSFDKAQDAERFCPKYKALSKESRIEVWAEMFSAMALFESSWSPTSRYVETTFKEKDPVTGEPVTSEGLLQMSYQDTVNYAHWLGKGWCGFDWAKDKLLSRTDARKTIFDPKTNIGCAVKVMANQIERTGKVILSSGVYWAVLKDGGKYSQVKAITGRVAKMRGC